MHIVGLDNLEEDLHLIISRFSLETITQLSSASILDLINNGINPEEQKFIISELISSSELGLEGSSISTIKDSFHLDAGLVDGLIAIVATLVGRQEHLLIKLFEVHNSINNCA
jgi:hypothetical protein